MVRAWIELGGIISSVVNVHRTITTASADAPTAGPGRVDPVRATPGQAPETPELLRVRGVIIYEIGRSDDWGRLAFYL